MILRGDCPRSDTNWGSVIGSGIGSAAGGAMGALMTKVALQAGFSEGLSSLLGGLGLGPSAFGGPIGEALYGNSSN